MKIAATVREYPGGDAATDKPIALFTHADPVTALLNTETDAEGRFVYEQNGSPGPVFWTAVDTDPDIDVTRYGSTRNYGSGGAYSLYELVYALRPLGNGVIKGLLGEMLVTDPGTGTQLDVAAGGVIAKGIPAIWRTGATHEITSTQDATYQRACYLVVRITGAGQAEEGRAVLVDLCGAPAASPVTPDLAATQTEASYDVPLATFRLGTSGAGPATDVISVADARPFPTERAPQVNAIVRRTSPSSVIGITSIATTGADVSGLTTTVILRAGVTYDLEARASLTAKAEPGRMVGIAPYIGSTATMAPFVYGALDDYALLANTHVQTVVGSGASVSCGLRARVTGGTASTATTGVLTVIARPRS